jgi:DDE superfamily endonuclease
VTQLTEGRFITPPCWHEGTERPIQRPKDPEEPQEYDNGKKKYYTLKNLVMIHATRHICFLSHSYEGKASDKSLAEPVGYTLLPGSKIKASRDSSCRVSRSSNPRKRRLGEN